jgi:hypothetical protein
MVVRAMRVEAAEITFEGSVARGVEHMHGRGGARMDQGLNRDDDVQR